MFLFVYTRSSVRIFILLYTNDITVCRNDSVSFQFLLSTLSSLFTMKDHGLLFFFLGIEARLVDDWAGFHDTILSTSSFCIFMNNNFISWRAKKQPTIARSSTEDKYLSVANYVVELIWLHQILSVGVWLSRTLNLYCDNICTMYLSMNLVFHSRTKHIELDVHFVRKHLTSGFAFTYVTFLRMPRS